MGGFILLTALALSGVSGSAHDERMAEPPAQPTLPIVAVVHANHAILGADACGAERCGLDNDRCGGDCCCGGHGPICSGGFVAPAVADLFVPSPSSDRLTVGRLGEMVGVARPPDERPPKSY